MLHPFNITKEKEQCLKLGNKIYDDIASFVFEDS